MLVLNKIRQKFQSEDRKRLLENFLSLSVLQGANYILPLITLPYLVRVLGPEKFGLIAFAQSFIQYFNILTDYGFNLSATREVSIYRNNKEKISEIFSSVMIIKFGLLVLSFIIMSIIVFSFKKFKNDWLIYYLTFGMVLGQILFPVWFFQGMERMKYITILNIVAKGIFTICIFIFIRKMADYLYVPLINSLGIVTAGVLGLYIIFKNYKVNFILPNFETIQYQLKNGWYIFISNVTGNIYGQGTVFILGLTTNNFVVGYYSAAEKLMKAIASLSQPLAQALYPYMVRFNIEALRKNFKKVFFMSSVMSFLIAFFVYVGASYIIALLYGKGMENSVIDLQILSIGMFFIILNVIKQPYIFAMKKDKANSYMYIFTGLSFIPVCFLLSYFLKDIGTSISLIYVEIIIFLWGLYILKDLWRKNYEKTSS